MNEFCQGKIPSVIIYKNTEILFGIHFDYYQIEKLI